jgi:hypothetical protein
MQMATYASEISRIARNDILRYIGGRKGRLRRPFLPLKHLKSVIPNVAKRNEESHYPNTKLHKTRSHCEDAPAGGDEAILKSHPQIS